MKGFLVAPPPPGDVDCALASLRASVGIARALNLSLVLPYFETGSGEWMPVAAFDEVGIAALVPILSQQEANDLATNVLQAGVHVVQIQTPYAGKGFDQTQRLAKYLAEVVPALALQPLPAASVVKLSEPMRSRAECASTILGDRPAPQILVLPWLSGTAVLSASASVMSAEQRSDLDRALATPSLPIRELAGRLGAAEAVRVVGLRLVVWHVPAATSHHATVRAVCELLDGQPNVDARAQGVNIKGVKPEGVMAADRASRASVLVVAPAGPRSPPLGRPAEKPAHAAQAAQTSSCGTPRDCDSDTGELLGALNAALAARGMSACACEEDLGVPSSSKGAAAVREIEMCLALRWVCTTAPLLLFPPMAVSPPGLITARQALGRVVDHAYVDSISADHGHVRSSRVDGAPLASSHLDRNGTEQPISDAPPATVSAAPPAPPPPPPPPARAGMEVAANAPKTAVAALAAAIAPPTSAAEVPSSARSDDLLALMASKLAPELRGRILDFHPEAPTLRALSRLGAQPTPLDVYDTFLRRTETTLRRLPFAPPPLGPATTHVAVIVEPRATPHIVERTAYVIRNVGVLLNTRAGGAGWAVQLFHGSSNREAIASHFTPSEWARVNCVDLGVDNLRSSQEYSQLLTSHYFWSRVGAEHVLIFQVGACTHAWRIRVGGTAAAHGSTFLCCGRR